MPAAVSLIIKMFFLSLSGRPIKNHECDLWETPFNVIICIRPVRQWTLIRHTDSIHPSLNLWVSVRSDPGTLRVIRAAQTSSFISNILRLFMGDPEALKCRMRDFICQVMSWVHLAITSCDCFLSKAVKDNLQVPKWLS